MRSSNNKRSINSRKKLTAKNTPKNYRKNSCSWQKIVYKNLQWRFSHSIFYNCTNQNKQNKYYGKVEKKNPQKCARKLCTQLEQSEQIHIEEQQYSMSVFPPPSLSLSACHPQKWQMNRPTGNCQKNQKKPDDSTAGKQQQ